MYAQIYNLCVIWFSSMFTIWLINSNDYLFYKLQLNDLFVYFLHATLINLKIKSKKIKIKIEHKFN